MTLERATYREQSRIFLRQAHEELSKGDLRQASEKGWGAAAEIVKAIASRRRWNHWYHDGLHWSVAQISQETGDDEFQTLFGNANALNANFYEGWLPQATVALYVRQVETFVGKVESLLDRG